MDDELQKIYDVVPRTEDVFNLNKRDLELFDKLGKFNGPKCVFEGLVVSYNIGVLDRGFIA